MHRCHQSLVSVLALFVALGSAGGAAAGPAVNQFEVKGVDVEQGELEVELQSDFALDTPRRKSVTEGGETIFDDNEVSRQRHSLEVGLGLTNWLRIGTGVEWEEERVDDPATAAEANDYLHLQLTEIQFEGLTVLVPLRGNGIGLGAYLELQVPVEDEPQTLFSGAIVQARSGPFSATGNFALVKYIGGTPEEGEARDEKLDFAYFTQIAYDVNASWSVALEAYGTIDRLGNSGNASEEAIAIGDQDQHRIGPAVYYTFNAGGSAANADDEAGEEDGDDEGTGVTLSAGILLGLNDNTPDTTIKTGLEVEF